MSASASSFHGPVPSSYATRLYFRCKRFIPRWLRLTMRKAHAARIMAQCQDYWPICEAAGHKPLGWPGWPGGDRFAFVLTHDVESRRGVERVRQLAELEMSLGFRSSFNFIPEGEYVVSSELRHWLTDRGFEVGVHDLHHDGNLYSSKAAFGRKARRVNHYLREWQAVGFRSGFMLHNLTWAHALDVLYEASTFDTDPFEPQPDGANTIFPFWVPAPDGNGESRDGIPLGHGYMELPYTLPQDSTVFIHLEHSTIDLWKRKLDWIAGKEGMALLLVHPDYTNFGGSGLDSDEFPADRYCEFLEYVKQQYSGQYWHALPKQVATYCAQFRPARAVCESAPFAC